MYLIWSHDNPYGMIQMPSLYQDLDPSCDRRKAQINTALPPPNLQVTRSCNYCTSARTLPRQLMNKNERRAYKNISTFYLTINFSTKLKVFQQSCRQFSTRKKLADSLCRNLVKSGSLWYANLLEIVERRIGSKLETI